MDHRADAAVDARGDFVGSRRHAGLVHAGAAAAGPLQPPPCVPRQGCRLAPEDRPDFLAAPGGDGPALARHPLLSDARIRSIARLGPSIEEWVASPARKQTVFGTVHLALWETQTWLKLLSSVPLPDFGVIYRPMNNPRTDAYVKRARERHGMRLLSRKKGFVEALGILRRGGNVGVLFDQNAGDHGALTTLFDRVCSTTELPGMLAEHTKADVRTFYPRRTGFWRVTFESDPVEGDGTAGGTTIALNRWLETALRSDEDLCSSWLWLHDRWRNQDVPARRFRLEAKRNLLADELRARGLDRLPRRTRVWVRLPNWLGDVVMALPFLRALRASRPDAEITVVAASRFLPLVSSWKVADRLRPLPPRGRGYFAYFWRMRRKYPDVWLLFTNSFRGDLEAALAGCPQRFGLARPGRPRLLLTHACAVPADFDEARHHQIELWERLLRNFGLEGAPGPPGPGAGQAPRERRPARLVDRADPRLGKRPVQALAGFPLAQTDCGLSRAALRSVWHRSRPRHRLSRRIRISTGTRQEHRRADGSGRVRGVSRNAACW